MNSIQKDLKTSWNIIQNEHQQMKKCIIKDKYLFNGNTNTSPLRD